MRKKKETKKYKKNCLTCANKNNVHKRVEGGSISALHANERETNLHSEEAAKIMQLKPEPLHGQGLASKNKKKILENVGLLWMLLLDLK